MHTTYYRRMASVKEENDKITQEKYEFIRKARKKVVFIVGDALSTPMKEVCILLESDESHELTHHGFAAAVVAAALAVR